MIYEVTCLSTLRYVTDRGSSVARRELPSNTAVFFLIPCKIAGGRRGDVICDLTRLPTLTGGCDLRCNTAVNFQLPYKQQGCGWPGRRRALRDKHCYFHLLSDSLQDRGCSVGRRALRYKHSYLHLLSDFLQDRGWSLGRRALRYKQSYLHLLSDSLQDCGWSVGRRALRYKHSYLHLLSDSRQDRGWSVGRRAVRYKHSYLHLLSDSLQDRGTSGRRRALDDLRCVQSPTRTGLESRKGTERNV